MLTDSSVCLLFLWLLLYVVGKLFLVRELRRIIFKSKLIHFFESRYLITNIWPLIFLYLGARLGVYFCSSIYLDGYALLDNFMDYNPLLLWSLLSLIAQNVPVFAIGSSFKLASVSFQQVNTFFEPFFTFSNHKMFQAHLIFFLSHL